MTPYHVCLTIDMRVEADDLLTRDQVAEAAKRAVEHALPPLGPQYSGIKVEWLGSHKVDA